MKSDWKHSKAPSVSVAHLTIRDGDDISRNVGRHVTGLGLNDRQCSEGATTKVVVHLGCPLKQTGVQVEHVTGVGLTARGPAEQQGHLTISNSLEGTMYVRISHT